MICLCSSVLTAATLLSPHDFFKAHNSEINESIDRSVFEAVDMNCSLNHLTCIVDSVFENEEDSGTRIFVEVGLSHKGSRYIKLK